MQLDRLRVGLRPRAAWQAIDLGFALGRRWFLPLWALWWGAALPLMLLCLLPLGTRPNWWLVSIWWCKPLYEAPLLIWVGRALFDDRPAAGEFRALLRAGLTRRLLPFLLWRRFGVRRSFLMPLGLLERVDGRVARERRRLMNAGGAAPAWLTLVCYHFEAILWASALLGLVLLVPAELPRLDLEAAITESGSWPYWISAVLYLFACSVIAPFYVCAGFAVYLARRTELEAWDLELAFRQARLGAARPGPPRQGRPAGARASLAGAAVLAILLAAVPVATPRADPRTNPDEARVLIGAVLADPDFGSTRQVRVWVPILQRQETTQSRRHWPALVQETLLLVARLFEWVLSGGLVVVVVLLARRVLRDWSPRRRAVARTAPGAALASLLAGVAPLAPAEVPAAVMARLDQEDPRGALAILYRASLDQLLRLGVTIPDAATEGECLALASSRLAPSALGPLEPLTRTWQRLAYAHQIPARDSLSQLLRDWCLWCSVPLVAA